MELFIRRQAYRAPLKAAVLDWAGTAVDYGCLSPTAVFVEVFNQFDVAVTLPEVRQFMGLMKKDHIREMCRLPTVKQRWQEVHNREPNEADVDAMYLETESLMISTITSRADLIPGCRETIAAFRARDMKIGSCTGYTRPMMEALLPVARDNGYDPDAMVCSSDVPAGRPYPWMCYRNAMELNVYPLEAVVKIGDTVADIEEGLNAGMWTIGLTKSGNELGLSLEEVSALTESDLSARLLEIEQRFKRAGAHYVVETIADCLPVIDAINERLSEGQQPLDALPL